jgi:hypothetical protein
MSSKREQQQQQHGIVVLRVDSKDEFIRASGEM